MHVYSPPCVISQANLASAAGLPGMVVVLVVVVVVVVDDISVAIILLIEVKKSLVC
jgi:hypothetical protein